MATKDRTATTLRVTKDVRAKVKKAAALTDCKSIGEWLEIKADQDLKKMVK